MKSLITGCAGFAGSHLADYLLGKGEEVVALVAINEGRANIQHIEKQLQIACGDVRDFDRMLEVLQSSRPQRIYHLAAFSSPSESFEGPDLTYQVNFTGTLNLLSAWLRVGMDCRLLFISSSEVYGHVPPEKLPMREEMELRPVNPYAGSKAAAELLALQFFQSYALPIVRVRPFNHTGPRQSSSFVCSKFARQAAEIDGGLRPPTIMAGNLHVIRDFSDVRDVVRGYRDLLEKGTPGEVYQLCSGRPVSIEAILHTVISFASRPVQISVDKSLVRDREADEVWGDYSKAKLAVGWEPRRQLADTLRDLKLYWEAEIKCRSVLVDKGGHGASRLGA
jgi:GDP-4-dehydro-6-deoxy-D-mannose reductase